MDMSTELKTQMEMARNVHDLNGLDKLRSAAQQDEQGALREVAKHFESLFVQMMLKGMRQSNDVLADEDNPMNSEQVKFYRDMHDQQLAVELTKGDGLGLADLIVRQLGGEPNFIPASALKQSNYGIPSVSQQSPAKNAEATEDSDIARVDMGTRQAAFADKEAFVATLLPVAEEVAAVAGIPAENIVAQAAVETGWGQQMIHSLGGSNSHNLFGIKAGKSWQGDKTLIDSLEYRDGSANKERSAFRAYGSFKEAMSDYVELIKTSPRYQGAVEAADNAKAYFEQLQQGGYATDPRYAEKVTSVLDSIKSIATEMGLTR